MTDKEIIKALQICTSEHLGCEDDCPFNTSELCGKDGLQTQRSALDLINHLKTKCNKYLNKVQAQKGELARLYKQNAEYKAEFERMQGNIMCVMSANARLINQVDKAKTEAIKSFAERLKDVPSLIIAGQKHYVIVESYFDNLVKEMVGDVE